MEEPITGNNEAIMGYMTCPLHCDIQYNIRAVYALFWQCKEVSHNKNAGKMAYSLKIMTDKVRVKSSECSTIHSKYVCLYIHIHQQKEPQNPKGVILQVSL